MRTGSTKWTVCLGVVEGVEVGVVLEGVEAGVVQEGVGGQVEGERVRRREAVRTGEVWREASGLWERCSSRDLSTDNAK